MKSVAVFLLFVAVAHSGKVCRHDSECQPNECCQILGEYMIVSKRSEDFLSGVTPTVERTGTCEAYKKRGDPCFIFDKINGYCDCHPGLDCVGIEIKRKNKNNDMGRFRRKLVNPRPGYEWDYRCRLLE